MSFNSVMIKFDNIFWKKSKFNKQSCNLQERIFIGLSFDEKNIKFTKIVDLGFW